MTGQHPPSGKSTEGLRVPQQSRSQQSTDRMLDAALTILDRHGMEGLSIAAVSRESGVSNGSLYHRFGDRHGLLVAAQDRFLDKVMADWLSAAEPLWEDSGDRDELLARLVDLFLRVFMEWRSVFHAFMVTGRADPELRARGATMMKRAASHFTSRLGEHFGCTPEAAGTAHQIMFAQAVLLVLFSEEETTAVDVDTEGRRRHLVRALRAVLQPATG
ncbi:TetR/AcrR family transcriptional regulator [Streptomyces sp. NPDC002643]